MADRAVLGGRPARQAVAPDPRSAPGVFLSQRRLLLSLRPHADPDEDPERVRGRVLVPVSLPAGARAVRRERRAPGDDAVRLLPFPDPLVGPEHPRRVGRVPDPLHVGQEPAAGARLLPPRARPASSGRLRARELPRLLLVLPLPVGHHLGAEGVLAAGDDPDLPPDAGGGAGRRVLRAGPFSRLLPGAAPPG